MTNGTIKEIDPIDETMNMIQNHRTFRSGSYAEIASNAVFDHSPEYIKMTKDNDEVT